MSKYQYLPLASWDDFERMCKDLFQDIWKANAVNLYGRNGCSQYGVDIYGKPNNESKIFGVQCKGKEIYPEKQLSINELAEEINKAKKFNPKLSHYIFTTTARRCPKLQSQLLNLEQTLNLEFSIEIMFWDDLVEYIECSELVREKHFSQTASTKAIPNLFKRANFTDRINIFDIYIGECGNEYVIKCPYYNVCGVVSKEYVSFELGGFHNTLPRYSDKVGVMRIDVETLSNLVEEFFFGEKVDTFDIDFNFVNKQGRLIITNDNVHMCGHYYIENSKVYDDTENELNGYDSEAYLNILNFMSNLSERIRVNNFTN